MLVINKEGVIFDLPDNELEKHALNQWLRKKDEVSELLDSLSKGVLEINNGFKNAAEAEVVGQGCCNAYPNYCPSGGGGPMRNKPGGL